MFVINGPDSRQILKLTFLRHLEHQYKNVLLNYLLIKFLQIISVP